MTPEEIDYKALCKKLFGITQHVFGIVYMPIKVKDQKAMLEKIRLIVGEAYDLQAQAVRDGLYKGETK